MTYSPCVMLCNLTMCYSIVSAWFQRLKLKFDRLLSTIAFNSNMVAPLHQGHVRRRRHGAAEEAPVQLPAVRHERQRDAQGGAVQVDPMKPMLKAPGTKRLNLQYDKLLSILPEFWFQFQLAPLQQGVHRQGHLRGRAGGALPSRPLTVCSRGAYTRPLELFLVTETLKLPSVFA